MRRDNFAHGSQGHCHVTMRSPAPRPCRRVLRIGGCPVGSPAPAGGVGTHTTRGAEACGEIEEASGAPQRPRAPPRARLEIAQRLQLTWRAGRAASAATSSGVPRNRPCPRGTLRCRKTGVAAATIFSTSGPEKDSEEIARNIESSSPAKPGAPPAPHTNRTGRAAQIRPPRRAGAAQPSRAGGWPVPEAEHVAVRAETGDHASATLDT